MSFEEFARARQQLVEEHIGTLVREAKRNEDRVAAKSKAHLGSRR